MFVSIVLNTEYMDIASRAKWYLKCLLHCKQNGWILITHEYMKTHIEELQKDITPSLFSSWELRPFTYEDIKDVEQYFIPDAVFEEMEQRYGSRSEMLFAINKNDDASLHHCLDAIVDDIKKKHANEKVDGIFNVLECFESIRLMAKSLHAPLISYSFSAIRKPHGYRQTLYHVNKGHFWESKECEVRWKKYESEGKNKIPVFTNREIIAILGKTHTLPLIQLMNSQPQYEMGICCEFYSLLPPVFSQYNYTDDDIFYECKQLYPKDKIKVRSHSLHLDDIQVDRTVVHNDPASYILSCKRLTAVQSQIILKVLLWNRTAVMKKDTLAFSFLCSKKYDSQSVADITALNYYFFAYLIPADLMFSDEYWRWRLTNPTETEIYWRHLDYLLNALGIDKKKVIALQGKERFKYLLEARGCDMQLIEELLSDKVINNINWDVASSQFDVVTPDGTKTFWRIDTQNEDGSLTTKLAVDVDGTMAVKFYPLYDVAGISKIKSVKVNGKEVELDQSMTSFKYMPKYKGIELPLSGQQGTSLDIECNWEYLSINNYLNSSLL